MTTTQPDQHALPPDAIEKNIVAGIEFQSRGNLAAAKGIFEEILTAAPRNFAALYSLSAIAYSQQRYDNALALIDQAIDANPDFVQSHNTKGVILMALQQYQRAIDTFDRALQLDPHNTESMAQKTRSQTILAQEAEWVLQPLSTQSQFSVLHQTSDAIDSVVLPAIVGLSHGGAIAVPMDKDYLCTIRRATILPFSDFIRGEGGIVACEKLYRKEYDLLIPRDQDLISRSGSAIRLRKPRAEIRLENCFNLFSTWMNQWAHFLAELFPKLAYLDKLPADRDIVIPVWENVDPHIHEVIKRAIGPYPRIVLRMITSDTAILADTLYHVELGTFVANDGPFSVPFNIQISTTTNEFWKQSFAPLTDSGARPVPTRKLFIGRKGGRSLVNYDEVLDYFVRHGFEEVFPHLLPYDEKVALFRSASHVVGPYSSGFTNVVFAYPRTRVLGLVNSQRYLDTLLSGYCKLAGLPFWLMTGKETEVSNVNSDYRIELADIADFAENTFFAEE